MSQPVIIHVGLQKTGTTWMQIELFDKMKNVNHIHDYRLEYFHPFDKKIIISMEWIAGTSYWKDGYDARMQNIQKFKRLYPDAKVIVGIREIESWIRSTYSQYVKNGGVMSYVDWRQYLFDKRFMDNQKYVNELRKNFKDVLVYTFDELKTERHKLVIRLCDFIDEPIPRNLTYKVYNKKFSDRKLNTLRHINKLFYQEHENPDGKLPGIIGYFFRWCVLHASGSWQ